MSKKRLSNESSNDQRTTEDSDAAVQQIDNTKQMRLASFSNKTPQDLPDEMLGCILVRAVVMEVKDMRLASSVWKQKADEVIRRLVTVCSKWSNILTSQSFQKELHRTLERMAGKKIRLEILHESVFNYFIIDVTTLKDEVLVFCLEHDHPMSKTPYFHDKIKVYDRNALDKVKEVISLPGNFQIKDFDRSTIGQVEKVITLPGIRPAGVVACNVSNCVYILEQHRDTFESSVFRVTRDPHRQLIVETWLTELDFCVDSMTVSPAGKLIIIESAKVSVYNPHGFLQQQIELSSEIAGGLTHAQLALEKPNRSLVLAYSNDHYRPMVVEINKQRAVERPKRSSFQGGVGVNFADASGKIVMYDPVNGMKLVDSELNPLEFAGSELMQDHFKMLTSMHYDSTRNEVMVVCRSHDDPRTSLLTIFRFRED